MRTLNPITWEETDMGMLPPDIRQPGKCAGLTMPDGTPGIFTRYGYWLNLETMLWEKKAVPPYQAAKTYPNALYSMWGKPTFFGQVRFFAQFCYI